MGVGHYSETDIREAARAFTGWNFQDLAFVVNRDRHDAGDKTVLGRTGRFDGVAVIDIILAQPVTAEFVASKIYRFLVREDVSPALRARLGAVLRDHRYAIAPLLQTIFLSRDFYSSASYATRIKSPVELAVSTYKKLGLTEIPGVPDFNETTSEEGEHRRVAGHADQQVAKVPRAVPLEELELAKHLAVVTDLLLAGGEVAVPEQGHFFFERAVGRQHALGPPVGDAVGLEPARAEPVEELVGDRLQAAVALRLHPHAERLARGLRKIRRGRPTRRERLEPGIVHAGVVERFEVAVVDGLIGDERRDGRLRRHPRKARDVLGNGAEGRTLEQVRRAVIAPLGGGDRRQVVDPLRRSRPHDIRHGSLRFRLLYTAASAM